MGSPSTSRSSRRWFAAGYALLAGFFALELATRSPGSASSLDASADDRDTTARARADRSRARLIGGILIP